MTVKTIIKTEYFNCVLTPGRLNVSESQRHNRKGDTMTISKDKQVSIEYTLKLDDDSVVDTNVDAEPLTLVVGTEQIIPGLEKELEGMKVGDSKKVTVSPEEGYGESNPKALVEVAKDKIPEGALKAGAMLQGQSADGASVYARVSEIRESTVVLDHNHPLAGKTLHFDVKILEISDPPKEQSIIK